MDGSLIAKQELFDSLFSLIPFLLLTRNMVIDFVSLESMNRWQGRKRAEAATTTIRVVVVNSGPIFLPMILSTIKTYNTIPFQIHRIDVESQQAIFPYKAKRQPNSLHFQLFVILNRFTHRFKYLDCLNLECISDICLFTHIELFFYSINPNSNLVNVVSRIDR